MKRTIPILLLSILFLFPVNLYAGNIFSQEEEVEIYDPLERYNRKIFHFNLLADKYTLKPLANTYRTITTSSVRQGVSNFFFNLKRPVSSVNSLLQQDYNNFLANLGGFVVDSTIGIFGIFKVSERIGIHDRQEDFGQTLAIYDFGPGPYLMLPILGPSNVRDLTGLAVDTSLNAPLWEAMSGDNTSVTLSAVVLDATSTREKILETWDNIEQNSVDSYAATRSMFNQYRETNIYNE